MLKVVSYSYQLFIAHYEPDTLLDPLNISYLIQSS